MKNTEHKDLILVLAVRAESALVTLINPLAALRRKIDRLDHKIRENTLLECLESPVDEPTATLIRRKQELEDRLMDLIDIHAARISRLEAFLRAFKLFFSHESGRLS